VFQPPRASNSRIRRRSLAVAASRCAESSAISSPSRSRSVAGDRTACGAISRVAPPSPRTLALGFRPSWEAAGSQEGGSGEVLRSGRRVLQPAGSGAPLAGDLEGPRDSRHPRSRNRVKRKVPAGWPARGHVDLDASLLYTGGMPDRWRRPDA
jgi:hypothetical protein